MAFPKRCYARSVGADELTQMGLLVAQPPVGGKYRAGCLGDILKIAETLPEPAIPDVQKTFWKGDDDTFNGIPVWAHPHISCIAAPDHDGAETINAFSEALIWAHTETVPVHDAHGGICYLYKGASG